MDFTVKEPTDQEVAEAIANKEQKEKEIDKRVEELGIKITDDDRLEALMKGTSKKSRMKRVK